jgi:hypothetical protein
VETKDLEGNFLFGGAGKKLLIFHHRGHREHRGRKTERIYRLLLMCGDKNLGGHLFI